MKKIPISKPFLDYQDRKNLIQTFDTSWISSNGKNIQIFEKNFSKYTGAQYSLTCSNGTIAIELSLKALGIKKNDQVIVPNLTFAATINAILNVGAIPVILDIEKNSFNYDPIQLKRNINSNTFAIIFVHLFGIPLDIKKFNFINSKIKIIEDCAESLGSKYNNIYTGNFSDCSTFSFFSNKIITTGEGGMINFKNKKTYILAQKIKNQGRDLNKNYWHTFVGGNYRMTNLQASLGITQLKKVNTLLKLRKKIYRLYDSEFNKSFRIIPIHNLFSCNFNDISYWYYTIKINGINLKTRDKIILSLKKLGIETRPMFYPLSDMKIYNKYLKGNSINSKIISYSSLSLPTYPTLTKKQIIYISNNIKKILSQYFIDN